MHNLAEKVAQALTDRQSKVATAESCTGGWIARELTSVAGSSSWFDAGFVSYSDRSKQSMLGVSEQSLVESGAVSEKVVAEMAEGALERSDADIAVAVCGYAGPSEGNKKPVGTMWFAWAVTGQPTVTCLSFFSGEREAVREQAVQQALDGLIAYLPK